MYHRAVNWVLTSSNGLNEPYMKAWRLWHNLEKSYRVLPNFLASHKSLSYAFPRLSSNYLHTWCRFLNNGISNISTVCPSVTRINALKARISITDSRFSHSKVYTCWNDSTALNCIHIQNAMHSKGQLALSSYFIDIITHFEEARSARQPNWFRSKNLSHYCRRMVHAKWTQIQKKGRRPKRQKLLAYFSTRIVKLLSLVLLYICVRRNREQCGITNTVYIIKYSFPPAPPRRRYTTTLIKHSTRLSAPTSTTHSLVWKTKFAFAYCRSRCHRRL